LQYLHIDCDMIHGDLKPRNLVEVHLDKWILIDLDASCALGTAAGQKVTSSGFFPPEMARRELDKVINKDAVPASVQFEVWYFGLLVLQLSTEEGPTLWQSTQADNILEVAVRPTARLRPHAAAESSIHVL